MFSQKDVYEKKWNKNLPWIEKYRPMTINDVISQTQVIKTLKEAISNNNLSHLLFYGPPGTGKTSAILAASRELYTSDTYKDHVLELNASDERGINIIRKKVKIFSQKTVCKNTKFKLVILDEADSMTLEAQSILRHIIEKYSSITRFCIICNYIDKIIEPLISRCNKFRFYSLDKKSIMCVLKNISNHENIKYSQSVMNYIYKVSNGDLRKAITMLQSAYYIYGKDITVESIEYIIGVLISEKLDEYIQILKEKNHIKIDNFCNNLNNESYSNYLIINQIFNKFIYDTTISDDIKSNIIKIITDSYYNLINKSNYNLEFIKMSYNIASNF